MADASAVQSMIEAAERATVSGDLTSAERSLREAARVQEASLGALHPDLASTFNNLGVLCERANKLEDAEQFFRRAHTVASASLDSRHPIVTTSYENLKEFCQAHGLVLQPPLAVSPSAAVSLGARAVVTQAESMSPGAARSRGLQGRALAASALVVALLLAWSDRTPPGPVEPSERPSATPLERESVPPPVAPSASSPVLPNVSSQDSGQPVRRPLTETDAATMPGAVPALTVEPAKTRPPAGARARDEAAGEADVQVIEAAVCRSLQTSGSRWQCDAASDPAAPGQVYFYTRLAAAKTVRVHHRWYRDDRLRQDIDLGVGANPVAGFRTYSRQTVDAEGSAGWRVELVTSGGLVLHEQRFTVR